MREIGIVTAVAVGLSACSQSAGGNGSNEAAKAPGKPHKERPPYCFFKDSETKAWAASRDAQGNVVVHGKAYRQDSRYQAQIGKMSVEGSTATVWPTIAPNMTGYGAPNDWWDVKAAVPNSRAVEKVSVRCGEKIVADLTVPAAK